jgi:tRNA threonylcarbamoyladenosine biosynthesis protein TsaE
MTTVISHSPAETELVGEQWGRAAQPGWVIGLSGDLGAGKTQLVKGLARGLGAVDLVHSPTFTLVHQYTTGRLPLFHLDLYRLETPEQICSAALEEFLQPSAVAVIEWVERWYGEFQSPEAEARARYFPACFRWTRMEWLSETDRRITYDDFGP